MKEILVACGDVALLKRILADLPQEEPLKPVATKKGGGIAAKIANRGIGLALVFEELADGPADRLLVELRQHSPSTRILLLTTGQPPSDGPFDGAQRYPVPGPVFRNALRRVQDAGGSGEEDLERWRAFYQELGAQIERLGSVSYYGVMGLRDGAPHHQIVKAFDALSLRYHPDRYDTYRDRAWGQAIYERTNTLYKAVTEAYGVLTDRRLRQKYEKVLAQGQLRLDPADTGQLAAKAGPKSLADLAQGGPARKFLKLAQTDLAAGDRASALQNLRFARSMEPDNHEIAAKIEEIEASG